MPKTLTLILFEQSKYFPNNTAHWGLLLREHGLKTGELFHAGKGSLITGMTRFEVIPDVEPVNSSSIRASVEVAAELHLSNHELTAICKEVEKGRRFDLIVNNCQRFCAQVLERLVANGTLTQAQYDALATKGFRPLV
ncbi:uncharacterized protein GIQ15_01407 [Arthroderma uncinatum]|uniref:uncharacterized protein n=1 Tax=Arthroderma uncinatum TaxID=74035 RepID=UPI00144AB77D|nr:uncharacterized protein GIQ15_01407 [Arthroderma uncinatum]KAF3491890.1 hypothetical protein GIQ15_01407 [Arthroderma uncinatum]